jgi:predicted glycogen debranching enzyme
MRGMIAAGMKKESLKILKAFASFEENGTLPNIIYGETAGNRDTADAQLWFIRCVQELGTSDRELLRVCGSIVDNYLKGTPNGIRVDGESALVWTPSHFTWMDTNYPACTPREGYPVEIQALWISALRFLGRRELAEKATESVKRLFKWEFGYRDCLSAPRGVKAANAVPEDTIRPNQLFLITLGILDDRSILRATEELLVPGGIRSLNRLHPAYRGVYAGDEDSSRKPSYHNGTVWAWPFPSFAEAMVMTKLADRETALRLLAGAVENLNAGCLCHMSEIADGDAPHAQKGCAAQAWSVSELLRVWLLLSGDA